MPAGGVAKEMAETRATSLAGGATGSGRSRVIHERHRLYHYAHEEAIRHKWIESQKAGRDLGVEAIDDWNRHHWWRWCRGRWLEHLLGEIYWNEFGSTSFGVLDQPISRSPLLQDRIVDRVKAGWENLDIIFWASRWGLDMTAVHEILETLHVNSYRFSPKKG